MKYLNIPSIILSLAALIISISNISLHQSSSPSLLVIQYWTIKDNSTDQFYFSKGKPTPDSDSSCSYSFIDAMTGLPVHLGYSTYMAQIDNFDPQKKKLDDERALFEQEKQQWENSHAIINSSPYINSNGVISLISKP